MNARIFVAISLPELVKVQLVSYQQRIAMPGIRIVRKENLHITVCFIGWVEARKVYNIEQVLAGISRESESFTLLFDQLIFAPLDRPPLMIWVLYGENKAFAELVWKKKMLSRVSPALESNTRRHMSLSRDL